MFDLVIRNGLIVDGTGRPAYSADLGVLGSQIACIGNLADRSAETVIDAKGLVVSPGFIDVHQHSEFTLLVNRQAESMVHQGVTTVVTGNCGHGCAPVNDQALMTLNLIGYSADWGVQIDWRSFGEYLERLESPGVAINVLSLLGHGAVRLAVMGFDQRSASQTEMAAMCNLVDRALDEGAAGISWGLEYSPGRHADRAEMDALSRVVAKRNGLYAIHVRDRAQQLVSATEEAVSVAERASLPIQLSHFAPRPYAPPDAYDTALRRLEEASDRDIRVGLDTFPRTWGLSSASSLLPPWVCAGAATEVLARLRQPEVRAEVERYWAEQRSHVLRSGGPKGVVLIYAPHSPELVGLDFSQIAEARGVTMADAACDILLAEGENLNNTLVRHVFATQWDLSRLLTLPNCAIASDGVASAPYGTLANLRTTRDSYGYAACFLQEYVRERSLFTLEEGVRRMTSLPADLFGLSNRGRIVENGAADIVVFDPDRVTDLTTDFEPNHYPVGFEWVLVNGCVVLDREGHTGALPGQVLRGGTS